MDLLFIYSVLDQFWPNVWVLLDPSLVSILQPWKVLLSFCLCKHFFHLPPCLNLFYFSLITFICVPNWLEFSFKFFAPSLSLSLFTISPSFSSTYFSHLFSLWIFYFSRYYYLQFYYFQFTSNRYSFYLSFYLPP